MKICVQVFVWTYVFICLECIPRSEIVGSHSNSEFGFLKNCQADFQSGCTILHSHKQCYQGSNFPHLLQHLLLPVFVTTTLLEGDEVVSPCIFLKANINKAFLDHSIFKNIIIFIIFYFWLHWFLVAMCGFFFNCGDWGYSLAVIPGLPTVVAFLVCEAHTIEPTDFSSCGTWAQ